MALFYNQATLSYSGGITNSNITTGELVEVLSATKDAVSTGYMPGDEVAYVINLVNTGDTAMTGITISDDLGAYDDEGETRYPLKYVEGSLRYYAGGILQTAPAVTAGPPLTITGISVPANSSATLLYEATVTSFAPLGPDAAITNTATITRGCSPLTAESTLPMETAPELTITKAMCPDVVNCGCPITYTFTIQNFGAEAATAEDAVVVTDQFDPILSDITVTLNGAS